MKNLNNYDWYCDSCNELLNNQSGFNPNLGVWYCKNCGEANSISEADIIDEYEYNSFIDSGFDSYNDYVDDRDSSERLSLHDAALIWSSHGKDDDYTFGYDEDDLEDSL